MNRSPSLRRHWILFVALAALPTLSLCQSPTGAANASSVAAVRVREYLTRLEGYGFAGNALVAERGLVVVESSHGLADRQRSVAWSPGTIFDVGSVTKQFTAAAILSLESAGKLRVEDSVARFIPGVPTSMRAMTIHHLLTHTSGLPVGPGDDYERLSRDEMIRMVFSLEPIGAPGERHAYSNIGYSVLAAIVEIVSGQGFDQYLRDRFFRPLGMASTGYAFSEENAARFARGYRDDAEWGIGAEKARATGGEFWNLIGNGGVHSTVGDLYRWIGAIERGQILDSAAREKLFRPQVTVSADYLGTGTTLSYAYGWYVWRQPSGRTLIWHLGGNGVFNAAIRRHVDEGRIVIYATNVSSFGDPAYPVPVLERLMAGQVPPTAPLVTSAPASRLRALAGRYIAATGEILTVEPSGFALKVTGEGQRAFSFVGSRRWSQDSATTALNGATRIAVETSRTGDYVALLQLFPAGTMPQDLQASERLFWSKRHAALGAYLRARVLGTTLMTSRRYLGRTIAQIDFERGPVYREYFWTRDRRIGDLGPITAAPFARYFLEAGDCFVTIEPSTAEVARICFSTTATGSSQLRVGGAADGIVLTSEARR